MKGKSQVPSLDHFLFDYALDLIVYLGNFNSYHFQHMVACIFIFVRYLKLLPLKEFKGSAARAQFLSDLRAWASRLVGLMLKYGTLEDRVFLLQQVLTTRNSNTWLRTLSKFLL